MKKHLLLIVCAGLLKEPAFFRNFYIPKLRTIT